MLRPQWLDGVIHDAIRSGYDAGTIAAAVANSSRFRQAIEAGIADAKALETARAANPKIIGATPAQKIRTAIQQAISADA